MTEEARMTRDIHNFVRGKMNMKEGTDLTKKVAQSNEWIDHLLLDMWIYEIATKNGKVHTLNKLD